MNHYEARSVSKNIGTAANVIGGVDTGINVVNKIKNFLDPPTPETVTASAAPAPTGSAATKRDMVEALTYLAYVDPQASLPLLFSKYSSRLLFRSLGPGTWKNALQSALSSRD